MPTMDKQLAGAIQAANVAVSGTQTNATATAQQAAPGSGKALLVTGFLVTASAAPAAAVQATLVYGTTTITIDIPATAFSPMRVDFGTHPLHTGENNSATLTVPALGTGVKCDAALFTITDGI
jgi:hypothetical protein